MALSQSVLSELLDAFRAGEGVDLVRDAVRLVMQELIEVEAAEQIGAERYERSDTRVTERNGSRPRLLATQAGDVELKIPKLRKGIFFPTILEPRRRIDQALYAVVMEAYVNGVSTRSVDDLVAALGVDSGISKSQVSRICAGLDEIVGAFRTRRLDPSSFPTCISMPPTCTSATRRHRCARWLSSWPPGSPPTAPGGARPRRRRQRGRSVLARLPALPQDPWARRGAPRHLRSALRARRRPQTQLSGHSHQRCRVHFVRNLLALVPKSHQDMVAAVFRTIFAQPDAATVASTWDEVRDQLAARSPRSAT